MPKLNKIQQAALKLLLNNNDAPASFISRDARGVESSTREKVKTTLLRCFLLCN